MSAGIIALNRIYDFGVTSLVRTPRPHEHDLDRLRSRVAELEAIHADRSAALAGAQADLTAFKLRYRHDVGTLHEELDRLELALAEAELAELTGRVEPAPHATVPPVVERPQAQPRFTTDAIRKLFRDVAKTIHPDLAHDADARDRRHSLMIEANRAYEMGDEEQLRSILDAWERSPDAVKGADAEAMRLRFVRRIAQLEEQLQLIDGDRAALQESPMWHLKAMVDEEAAKGKDLVADMVRRLKRDILVATNRLDALRPPA
jgi:hypothetical protein